MIFTNKLLKYLKGHLVITGIAPFLKFLEALFELVIPLVVASIIDVGIKNNDFNYILICGAILLGLGVFGLAFSVTAQRLAAKVSLNFGANVRTALFNHIQSLDTQTIAKYTTESLVTRLTNDTISAQNGVSLFLRLILRAPFIAIGSIVMAIIIDFKLSLIFIAMAVLVSVVLIVVSKATTPRYQKIQSQLDEVSSLSRSSLNGNRVIRAYNREEKTEKQFLDSTNRLEKTSIKTAAISTLINPFTFALVNLAVIAVLWFGGKSVYYGELSTGQLVALVNYLTQILNALVVLSTLIITFSKASSSAKRINELLEIKPENAINAENATTTFVANMDELATDTTPPLTFSDVSFAYKFEANSVIKDISFSLNSGETLGIIGATASGKSTIANLAARLLQPTKGEIRLFNKNINEINSNILRSSVGYVQQKALLFSGSIRDNIRFSSQSASDEDIIAALKAASADFAIELGLDYVLNEGGKNLSGGQKQRLTIARALLVKPKLLILDDACSALDFATESQIKKSIAALKNTATLLISQRISSVANSNKIMVLENGKIVGFADHKQLLETCQVYKDIFDSQM